MAAGGLILCALLPSLVFYVVSYRQNLGVAREKFASGPALSSGDRLLILSPHCDDETLGAGGIIARSRARGLRVRVVFMTNGDGSRSMQIAYDVRHMKRDSMRQLAAMRQKETIAALAELGIGRQDIVFLGYPDGGTQAMWQTNWSAASLFRSSFTGANRSPYANSRTPNAPYCGQSALNDVIGAMRDFRPTLVLTTHPADTHPDHWAAYAYARAALESLRLDASTHAWAQHARLLTFLVHHGAWPVPHGYHPDAVLTPPADLLHLDTHWMQSALDEQSQTRKTRALSRYASQLATTPQFLRGFLRRNELFGEVVVQAPKGASNPASKARAVEASAIETSAIKAKKQGQNAAPASSPALVPLIEDATGDSPLHDLWPAADLESVSWRPTPDPNLFSLRFCWRATRRWPAPRPQSSRWSASRGLLYRLSLHSLRAPNETAKNAPVPNALKPNAFAPNRKAGILSKGLESVGACEIEVRSSPQPRAVLRSRSGSSSSALNLTVRRIANGLEIDVPRNALNPSIASSPPIASSPQIASSPRSVNRRDVMHSEQAPMSLLLSASTFLGQTRLDQTATGTLRLPASIKAAPLSVSRTQTLPKINASAISASAINASATSAFATSAFATSAP